MVSDIGLIATPNNLPGHSCRIARIRSRRSFSRSSVLAMRVPFGLEEIVYNQSVSSKIIPFIQEQRTGKGEEGGDDDKSRQTSKLGET